MGFYNDNKIGSEESKTLFKNALFFARQGRAAQAFALFSKLSNEENAAVQFNLGILSLRANEPQNALLYLEKALRYTKNWEPSKQIDTENSPPFKTLRAIEISDKSYLLPLSELQNAHVKQDITMALIYAYCKCSLNDKAKALANSLVGEQFDSFKETLQNGNL